MKGKKFLTMILAIAMIFSIAIPSMAANINYGYTNTYGGYNNYNYGSVYSGDNYYNTNFSNGYYGTYYMSSWASDLESAYDPTWYESPQRQVVRGEAFLVWLRAVQHALDRQGYSRLMSGFGTVPFSDYGSINPYAQGEVNVLYANGILVGYDDNTMRFSQLLKRSEMAAIYSRFNRIFFNMGVGYNQNNYMGYNDYYNNNYNTYYNNYVFNDIIGHWAQQDIITAASNGVLQGVGNGYFDTEGPLTIEQIWAMLDRCLGYQGMKRADVAYAMSQTFKVKFGKNIDETGYMKADGTKITRLTSTSTLTLTEGESRNIKVTVYPSNAQYQKLNWTSSDTYYVSVEEAWNSTNGTANVTIYGRRAANSYITVTGRAMDGSGATVTIKVKVNANNSYNNYNDYNDGYVTSVTASENTIYLQQGESKQVNVKVKPSSAYNKNINWTSQNTSIAYISNVYTSGNYSYSTIMANNIGETDIYARATDGSGEYDIIHVVVGNGTITDTYLTSAVANPSSLSINVGNSQNIYYTAYPTDATNKNITWLSDNENVAKVQNNGGVLQIIAVGVGNTYIRGIAGNGNTICTIPITVSNGESPNPVNPGTTDTTPPIVTLEGATSVNIYDTITIVAKATDETNLAAFNITVNDIIGMTGVLSPTKIEKISNTEYRITLMGVDVASQCICIKGGVAVDTSGNRSGESNEIVIFVNSGEN